MADRWSHNMAIMRKHFNGIYILKNEIDSLHTSSYSKEYHTTIGINICVANIYEIYSGQERETCFFIKSCR